VGLAAARGGAAAVLDFDIEGDLDVVVGGASLELLRNRSGSSSIERIVPAIRLARELPEP
jgi:hypothetical protein